MGRLEGQVERRRTRLTASVLAMAFQCALTSLALAEPLTLPDRAGPAAADRPAKVDRTGMPARPELVEVVWKARAKPTNTLTINVDGRTIGARNVVKTAEQALRQAFGQVAATFTPPLRLKIEVTRFDIQRHKNGFTFLIDTIARDARTGEILYRDRGESGYEIVAGTDDDGMQKGMSLALRDLAEDASNRMLNREFRKWSDAPTARPKWWLGVGVFGPLVATLNGTWWWSDEWSLAVQVAPVAPRLGATVAAQRELHRADELSFGVGVGLGRALASTLVDVCQPTVRSCQLPRASTWAQVDLHLAWHLGERRRHRLGLAGIVYYDVQDELIGDPGQRGVDASLAFHWQYGF